MNYIGLINDIHRDQRRKCLFESHQFDCFCTGCNLSEEHLKDQNKLCDEFNRLMYKKKEVKEIYKKMENSDTTEELKCIKELYKTAKNLGIFRRVEMLNEIVEEGFDAACQGRVNERMD